MPAPVGPLMALVMRILRVDGSRASLDASLFASQQASLRSELPALHLSALELLSAALRGVRGCVPLSFLLPLVIAFSLSFEVFLLHGRILSAEVLESSLPFILRQNVHLFGLKLDVGWNSQLLPRGAALANLLTDHFRHTGGRYPDLRIKLYAISRDLFIAMGAGKSS